MWYIVDPSSGHRRLTSAAFDDLDGAMSVAIGVELEEGEVIPVSVVNGDLISRTCVPRFRSTATDTPNRPSRIEHVVHEWGFAPVTLPPLDDYRGSDHLRRHLVHWALGGEAQVDLPVYAIDAEVYDRWSTPYGVVELDYQVSSDHPEGRVRQVSNVNAARLSVDRSLHLTGAPVSCRYCGEATCPVCIDPARACDLCSVVVCGRCAAPGSSVYTCPACRGLRPLGWRKRRSHRHVTGRAGKVAHGADAVHEVYFVVDDSAVTRIVARNGNAPDVCQVQGTPAVHTVLSGLFGPGVLPALDRVDNRSRNR